MEVKEFKAKTVDEAITAATLELGISSDKLQYEVVDEGSKGFLGIFNSKPAVIKVILKKSLLERTQEFCDELFAAMKVETTVNIDFREEDNVMNIDLSGSDMGILIGKRGQTLDALQYLISLYVNRESDAYIRVKLSSGCADNRFPLYPPSLYIRRTFRSCHPLSPAAAYGSSGDCNGVPRPDCASYVCPLRKASFCRRFSRSASYFLP